MRIAWLLLPILASSGCTPRVVSNDTPSVASDPASAPTGISLGEISEKFSRYGSASFRISISPPTSAPTSFRVHADGIDAIEDVDFLPTDYVVTVPAGSSDFAAAVPLINEFFLDTYRPLVKLKATVEPVDSSSPYQALSTELTLEASLPLLTGIETISISQDRACALLEDGSVQCWGAADVGHLGNGDTEGSIFPVTVSGITAVEAYVGNQFGCALLDGGSVKCWGVGSFGRLGNGNTANTLTPVSVTGISTAASLAVGGAHSCAILSDNSIQCWGHGASGQLGNADTQNALTPVNVQGITNASVVVAGGTQTCAILQDGSVQCWGYGISNTPVTVVGITNPTQIATGEDQTCALFSDGTIQCWGDNALGQLGDGTTNDSLTPVTVSGINNAISISAGLQHTCALLDDGTVKCWGQGSCLGDGKLKNSLTSVSVNGLADVVYLASGWYGSCAVLSDGTAKCWGDNESTDGSRLGIGKPPQSPWLATSIRGITAKAFSSFSRTLCALGMDNGIWCWGGNGDNGVFGNNNNDSYQMNPTLVAGTTGATGISMYGTACSVLSDGKIKCWGYGFEGQLGNNDNSDSAVPVDVDGINTATSVSVNQSVCARLSNGKVNCWGYGEDGQLGNNNNVSSSVPVEVSGISTATDVAAGYSHSCALLQGGSVKCWGKGQYGQLGNGNEDEEDSFVPVDVVGITSATSVRAGEDHTCALIDDGTVQCWGDGTKGQMGNGDTESSLVPTPVFGIDSAIALGVGDDSACAVLRSGSIQCWGDFEAIGAEDQVLVPVTIPGIQTAVAVSAGYPSCALLEGGFIQCWGFHVTPYAGTIPLPVRLSR